MNDSLFAYNWPTALWTALAWKKTTEDNREGRSQPVSGKILPLNLQLFVSEFLHHWRSTIQAKIVLPIICNSPQALITSEQVSPNWWKTLCLQSQHLPLLPLREGMKCSNIKLRILLDHIRDSNYIMPFKVLI